MRPVVREADARTALEAVPGVTWRPIGRSDLPAVARFYAECEAFDRNPERHSLAGLEEFWDSPRSRPDQDTLLGVDGMDRIVATAWAGCNRVVTDKGAVHLGGAVHPSRRGEGIGRAALRWQIAHGVERDRSGMHAAALGVDAANPSGALRMYESLGYEQTASTCVHQVTQAPTAPEVTGAG